MEITLKPGEALHIRVHGGWVTVESSERTARVLAYPESGMQAIVDRFSDAHAGPNAATNVQVILDKRTEW